MGPSDPPSVRLTEREQEVLKLLSIGLSAKETAKILSITPRTVEQHIDNVRLKTRTRNRLHMVADLIRMGLISLVGFLPASYLIEAGSRDHFCRAHALGQPEYRSDTEGACPPADAPVAGELSFAQARGPGSAA